MQAKGQASMIGVGPMFTEVTTDVEDTIVKRGVFVRRGKGSVRRDEG